MGFERRRLLRIMSFALGSSMLLSRAELGVAAQTATPPKPSSRSAGAEVGHGLAGEAATEKVTGIGGLFFRAKDPAVLGRWYQQHLGIALTPANYNDPVWEQEAGPTVFSPFPQTSNYFGDTQKMWMVNFRVRDLDKTAAQLEAAGIAVKIDPQTYPNGRFARLHDPEGNPIELSQSAKPVKGM